MRTADAFQDLEESYGNVYSAEDLSLLKSVLEEALGNVRTGGGDESELKSRIAVALFRCAETGERDRAALVREASRAARPN